LEKSLPARVEESLDLFLGALDRNPLAKKPWQRGSQA
jgi:hypothetical protein